MHVAALYFVGEGVARCQRGRSTMREPHHEPLHRLDPHVPGDNGIAYVPASSQDPKTDRLEIFTLRFRAES